MDISNKCEKQKNQAAACIKTKTEVAIFFEILYNDREFISDKTVHREIAALKNRCRLAVAEKM